MSFFEDVVIPAAIIGAMFVSLFAAVFVMVALANKVECGNLNEITKRHTEFRWFGGCYVEHDGEMLPYERWKLLDVRVTNRK